MAEAIAAIGIVASVAQLADYGFKLSVKLFSFSRAVSAADESIKAISNDVSLTSAVLQELCRIIKSDESNVVSPRAVEATQQTVNECLQVFEQLNDALDKSLANLGKLENVEGKAKVKRGTIALEKLKWPFKQPKMELLRSNLDRLKESLGLMLQVLSYARDLSNSKTAESSLASQQHLIERMARSERAANRRYHSLVRAIENRSSSPSFNTSIIMAADITTSRGIVDTPQHVEPSTPPAVKPRTLIGELLLCFQLLNDILGYHMAVTKYGELSLLGYDELRLALEKIQNAEMKRLEAQYGDASIYIKSEAAQNLHIRLRELARAGHLKQRVHEDVVARKAEFDIVRASGRATDAPDRTKIEEARTYLATSDYFKGVSKDAVAETDKQDATPYDPYIPSAPTADRTSKLQAQIDDTVGVMRENINKVSQRGEKLDTLEDKTDNLAVSAQGFRRGANRVRKLSPWKSAYLNITENVARLSIEGYKTAQGISGSIYEAGTALFSESKNEGKLSNEAEDYGRYDDEEDAEVLNENIVGELLGEWTTLPLGAQQSKTRGDQAEKEILG